MVKPLSFNPQNQTKQALEQTLRYWQFLSQRSLCQRPLKQPCREYQPLVFLRWPPQFILKSCRSKVRLLCQYTNRNLDLANKLYFAYTAQLPIHSAPVIAPILALHEELTESIEHFLDNEHSFNKDQLAYALNMPTIATAYTAALTFINHKGVSLATATASNAPNATKKEFATLLAERYYKVYGKWQPTDLITSTI